ncbi:MAG: ammonium transporter [Gammaproteobacteria bacterium]|jgi:Amt family ammonium transporter|nr:ammonium transporter [Gammaproteobacteria bacterium]HJO12773.1 ammonium transporter [Gammaproteobacteria bacterium]|tara:strand:- start:456 stop:1760 length:1305 start_codon:yes stop_codon:yes gene_type:complete
MLKILNNRKLFLLVLLLFPSVTFAQGEVNGANTAWILTSTALVLFMTLPGLSLFYGGLVRSKNVLSVLMQCFSIAVVISLLWLAVGYSIAFGPSESAWWGGLSKAMFNGVVVDSVSGDIPETVFAAFQMTFAIITPALVVGAFVERIKFSSMLIFSILWTLVVYFPVANWVWGGGWLGQMGLIDFAGGTVVHITAGVAAIVTAVILGQRTGFPTTPMMPHNLTMSFTGAAMLWVGWFGFNAGSALAADGSAGMALFATHISAATGAATWMIIEKIKHGKSSGLGAITGMVAGLATITPASGSVGPAGALVVGLAGGVICFFATTYLKQVVKIDDSLDVFPVHGIGGMVGTFLAGVMVSGNLGIFSGNGYADGATMGSQVGVQLTGIAAVAIYTAIVTFVLLKLVGALTSGIRVSDDQEQVGLDITDHDEKGYSM